MMKTKLSATQKKLLGTLLFLAKIFLFSIPLYVILQFHGILLPLQEAVNANAVWVLNAIGIEAHRSGFLILAGNGIAFIVSEDCTGWKSMLLLAALMCAVPRVPPAKRAIGIAAGAAAVYLGNLFRIMIVVIVWRSYGLQAANALHDFLWQAGLILLVILIWMAWLIWTGSVEKTLIKRLRKLIKSKMPITQNTARPKNRNGKR